MIKDEAREVRSCQVKSTFWTILSKQQRIKLGLQGRKRKDHIFIWEKKRTLTTRWPRPKLKDVRVGGGGKKEPK